jgi:hypothetical protein
MHQSTRNIQKHSMSYIDSTCTPVICCWGYENEKNVNNIDNNFYISKTICYIYVLLMLPVYPT